MTKTFRLLRFNEDIGEKEVVAEGVQFSDGKCTMRWLTDIASIAVYDSLKDLIAIHGHKGSSVVMFDDEDII